MNERIRELTDLAMRQLGCGYTVEDAGLFASRQVRELINETAELIVAECIKLNGKELAMPGHSRMVDVYCEHFGIKL